MKEKLEELARKNGFSLTPESIVNLSSKYIIDEYYLWLCELQKWLLNNHYISIRVERFYNHKREKASYQVYVDVDCSNTSGAFINEKNKDRSTAFESYELALEKGVSEALKLIK